MEEARRYFRLNDVEAYRVSFKLSNHVWDIVLSWSPLAQQTVGTQLIRAMDSVSANLAEGFGRHGKKDKIKFYRIARGSLMEVLDWNEKVKVRRLSSTSIFLLNFNCYPKASIRSSNTPKPL